MAKINDCSDDSIMIEIINAYGRDNQLAKLAEELTEAGAAIQSWRNSYASCSSHAVIQSKRENAHKELADVLFCLSQIDFLDIDKDKINQNLSYIREAMISRLEKFREHRRQVWQKNQNTELK